MGGPAIGLWFRSQLTADDLAAVDRCVKAIAGRCETTERGYNFSLRDARPIGDNYQDIYGRPLYIDFEEKSLYYLNLGEIEAVIGFSPHDEMFVGSMSNSDEDHRLVARLCIHLATLLDGVIEHGSELPEAATEIRNGKLWLIK